MSTLTRGTVKADNSCLFTAIARLCENIESEHPLKTAGRKLRGVCAEAAAADPDPQLKALLLGHDSIELYAAWINNDHHWGGEPEVVMLAAHFGVEIVICSCESLSFLRYSPEEAASSKGTIYLLYTGQHYDPLLGADGTLIFPSSGESLEASALQIAKEHNEEAARRANEKRVKRLKCSGCGEIITDAAAFQEHCTTVEHDDDFTYDCEEVEVVVQEGEAMPEGSVDLNAPDVHAFYNAMDAGEMHPTPLHARGLTHHRSTRALTHPPVSPPPRLFISPLYSLTTALLPFVAAQARSRSQCAALSRPSSSTARATRHSRSGGAR